MIWFAKQPAARRSAGLRCGVILALMYAFLCSPSLGNPRCFADQPERLKKVMLLREGTRIPPTTGRIVMLGRRWVFVAVRDEARQEDVADQSLSAMPAYLVSKAKPQPNRLDRRAAPVSNDRSDTTSYRTVASPLADLDRELPLPFEQIMLQENLMLQRIVEAIRNDATDDHWVISGEVTEFFNENRLMIQLAQRASRR